MSKFDFHPIDDGYKEYPTHPADVPMFGESSEMSTFGSAEVERIAGHLLSFFKDRGRWCSFTITELRDFYKNKGWDPNLMFYGLIGGYIHFDGMFFHNCVRDKVFLVPDPSGKYFVTDLFIEHCVQNLKKVA